MTARREELAAVPKPVDPEDHGEAERLIRQMERLSPAARLRILHELQRQMQQAMAAPAATEAASNRRRHPRQRVLRSGKIIWNGRASVMDCQIRDLSAGGCRLRVASTVPLPSHFDLRLMGEPRERPCEVRWRTPQEIGVRFLA